MNSVLLVARREVLTRLRSRAFVVGTVSIIAIMAAYIGLMTFLGRQGGSTAVGVPAGDMAVARQLQVASAQLGEPIELRQVPDAAAGERLVRDGDLDALLTGIPDAVRLVFKQEPDDKLRGALEGVLRQRALDDEMTRAGLDPSEVLARTSGAHVAVRSLESTDPLRGERLAVAIVSGVLLYMFLLMGGNMVAQGVVEEKSSRVVELLLSTIRPTPLLAGKVLGIGAVTLLQLVVITAVGATGAAASGKLSVPSGALSGSLLGTVAWFLLGFALYATLMAAGASLVSRQEDLQSVVGPMTMLLVAPFVIGVSVLPAAPDSALAEVLSLVPLFSPVLMPMRIALGVAPLWEVALSVVLTLAAIGLVLRTGARIYSNAVLRTGARVRLRDALRAG